MVGTPSEPIPLLGERIRRVREARSMTQDEPAAQMDKPSGWIADVETGQHPQVDARGAGAALPGVSDIPGLSPGAHPQATSMHAPAMRGCTEDPTP